MKANELMVGDWVYMKAHRGFDAQYIKVESIPDSSSDTHYGHIGAYPISEDMDFRDIEDSHLKPIPLTPEILEKNGFVMDKEEKTHGITYHILIPTGYEANSYTIQITLYKEPICGVSVLLKIWGWIPPYDGGINDIHLCGAKYVHELQHALRLCGIDKEIVL